MPDFKTCGRCKQVKSLDQFYKLASSPDGRQVWCKKCQSEAHKAWQSQPEVKAKLAAYMRRYRRKVKENRL
jgi:hypothetical protein